MTALATSQEAVFADFVRRVDLAGATVVEIGGDLPAAREGATGVARWVAVDPRADRAPDGSRSAAVRAAAEALPLGDGTADAVFSSNALQFVDVVATLREVRRVLRPGGLFYAHFGPIWSGVDGHQLEYVAYRGRDLVFWRDTLLPPWAHLRYDRAELAEVLRTAVPADLAELLVWHVFDSPTVNRSFFEDYVAAALASGLDWVEVAASAELDYVIETPPYDHPAVAPVGVADVAEIVARRTGRRVRPGIRDVRMVLRRGPVPDAPL